MTTATDISRLLDDWGAEDIAPGGCYTHQFTTIGYCPYFLAGHPDRTGLVVVLPTLSITKACDSDTGENNRLACTISIENTSFENANVVVSDRVPEAVSVVASSVVDATQTGPTTL
jgi:uncharacterized repeat protein (TIGR01451 family)